MAWFTVFLVLTMVLCTVCATIKMTHFTLQYGETAKPVPTQLQIICLNKTVRACAVKCATKSSCLSFRSGRMTVWVRKRWASRIPSDSYDSKRFSTSTEQEHKIRDECSELPKLRYGKWKRLKKTDSTQTASVICSNRHTSSCHQREITCDKAKEHWRTIDSDCKTGTWTYLDVSKRFDFPYAFQLKDLKAVVLTGIFHHQFVVFFHNSRITSFKLKFTLTLKKVEVLLLPKKRGKYSKVLRGDAPKSGKQFMLVIRVIHGYLRFRLSRGERSCPVSVHGLLEGVDKLVLENPGTIKKIRIYFK